MFTAAVFEMFKRRKQPDCPSAESEYLEAHVRGWSGCRHRKQPATAALAWSVGARRWDAALSLGGVAPVDTPT